ncbi:MAG: CRISPR-associated helicase/endonuclease Cas3 [Candidatus Competibacteraceae bacterium]|jgi:CRISPR-associated endonuclease/helicase Cas3|nr:CRISPR-associated helicase/endonuclease Cas3 [Candidatus Competibacteraceae bacterium]
METEAYFRYWGKAALDYPGEPKWHPLVYHALDVTAVAVAWWDGDDAVRATFRTAFRDGQLTQSQLRAWILFFIALHDIGKFDVCFQLKAPLTVREVWPDLDFDNVDLSKSTVARFDHGSWGFCWAMRERQAWTGIADWPPPDEDSWRSWLQAVTGHHGDLPQDGSAHMEYESADYVMDHDRKARHTFVLALSELFLNRNDLSFDSPLPVCTPASQALLAGFCSVCDWIGSNIDVMPYRKLDTAIPLERYFEERLGEIQNQRWLHKFGVVSQVSAYRDLSTLLKPDESPRGVQVLVDDLDIRPGLMLIEAPTGSGKTEAALAHAWRLLESGTADSIVFALPTQATANAMLKRAEAFAEKAFSDNAANVVLAHGKRGYNEGFQRLVRAGYMTTAQGSQEASAQCSLWLAQSRKRVFLGQIGVCTVDQVLLSVLPVRHKFVRGFGINRSVLIVDEVHAYDSYMHGLLVEVLRRQREVGGSAILLSATLPAAVRNKLLGAWGSESTGDAPYPVLWMAGAEQADPLTVPEGQRPPRREVFTELLKLPAAMPDQALLNRIVTAAKAGARVAVVCNLVDNAQRLARQLRDVTDVPVDIFHARYRFMDRQLKEAAVLDHYGRDAVRNEGRILIATQVVEQSLDLDFDWLITQICPVDLLFQRIGRLHRHDRARPKGFGKPRCTVLSVETEDYGLFELIYGNARVLWRTEQLLGRHKSIVFPKAYRDWIEAVYGEEAWAGEPEAVIKSYDDFWARQKASEIDARQMISTPRKQFSDDDVQITVKTRDGEMSATLLAVQADGRCLDGTSIEGLNERDSREILDFNSIPVPASWEKLLRDCDSDEDGRYRVIFNARTENDWIAQVGKTTFSYSEEFGLGKETDELA